MRAWEGNTPREYVLRLYKFLNLSGYTVVGIDARLSVRQKTFFTPGPQQIVDGLGDDRR